MKNLSRFNAKLPEIQASFQKHRWLFLTLTVPNCRYEDLRETVKVMNKGWARLIERKDWPATGWIRTTEVTNEANADKGLKRAGYAHPHFHVLMMVPPSYFSHGYISQARWLELWQESMRNPEIGQVNIKAIKPGDNLREAVQETLKYSLKVEDALSDPDFLYCMTEQLHKMRFIASGGVLKDLLKEQMTDAEMIEGDQPDGAEIQGQLTFDYNRKAGKYQLVK